MRFKNTILIICSLIVFFTTLKNSHAITFKTSNQNNVAAQILNDNNYHSGWISNIKKNKNPWIKIELNKPQFILNLAIFPSILPSSKNDRSWDSYNRPKTITLIFSDGSKKKAILKDLAELQLISINKTISYVKIFLGDFYQNNFTETALAECRLISQDHSNFTFDLELDNQSLKKNTVDFYGIFHIKTPLDTFIKNQLPIQAVFCLNKTPSKNTQEQIHEFLSSLNENDAAALIQNNKKAKVLSSLKNLDAEHKQDLNENLTKITQKKVSNIQSSIEKAIQLLKNEKQTQETLPILILTVNNSSTFQLNGDLLNKLLSIPKLSIYIIDNGFSDQLQSLVHKFPGKYYFNVIDNHVMLESVFSHIQHAPYHNLTLTLFNPQGYELHAKNTRWQKLNNDYVLRLPSPMPGETNYYVIPFLYDKDNNSILNEYNIPSYIQGLFNYQDQSKQAFQQSLLFKVIPQKNDEQVFSNIIKNQLPYLKENKLIKSLD